MPKPTITGRVPQPLKDEFDEYKEDRNLSMSDAQRELLRAGLDAKAGSSDEPESSSTAPRMDSRVRYVGAVGLALALLAVAFSSSTAGVAASVLVALAPSLAAAGAVLVAVSYLPRMMESDDTENRTAA
jgi:hypothetical protein